MKRRFFIVRALGSVAALACATHPAPARVTRGTDGTLSVALHRYVPDGAIPGGCGSHRRRSPFNGYTLADATTGRPFA